ncbi:uncharacterized protein [Physcomitrium patens]|uniref:uncharacterized protein n=1 Tax=Physcomitrium patens TaxID=3218 RepID=UPI003CCE0CE2
MNVHPSSSLSSVLKTAYLLHECVQWSTQTRVLALGQIGGCVEAEITQAHRKHRKQQGQRRTRVVASFTTELRGVEQRLRKDESSGTGREREMREVLWGGGGINATLESITRSVQRFCLQRFGRTPRKHLAEAPPSIGGHLSAAFPIPVARRQRWTFCRSTLLEKIIIIFACISTTSSK